jgi:hypothetical protein
VVVGEHDPGVDTKRSAGSHPPNGVAQRINVVHQQIRAPVQQIDREKEGSARDPVAAIVWHGRSMPGPVARRNALSRLGKNCAGLRLSQVYDCGMTTRTYKSGQSRDQASFLPPRIEDYVGKDNPVRAIDGSVDALDLIALGFRDVGSDGGAGQPPYDPGDLLKLYRYG